MKKKFITNLAFLLFLNLLIKPFYVLGIDVGIQNTVTASSYGIYFPLLSLSLMFQVLLDMGLENFTRREIAHDPKFISKYLLNIVVFKLFLALIYFTFCIIIGFINNYSGFQLKILIILLFNQFIASFILYMRANFGGLQMFKTESIISVLDKTILIIICGFLLWGNVVKTQFKIEWFVYAQTFAYSVTFLISVILLAGKQKIKLSGFNLKTYFSIVKMSLPYALLYLLMGSYYRIDSVLLERLSSDGSVSAGIYAHSFRLLEMLQNYGYLFSLILLPMFSRMLKNKEPVGDLVNISSILIIVPAFIVTIGSVFYNYEIIDLLYDEHLITSSKVFRIIMPGFLGICVSYIFGTLLTANGNLKELILISAAGAILSILINIIFIKSHGAVGSAVANVTAQTITAVFLIITAVIKIKLKVNLKVAGKLLLFVFLLLIMAFLSKLLHYNWIINFSLYLIASFVIVFVIRLIKIKSIIWFFSKN